MNRKGFTLVEILATIVILSIIMVLIYPTINETFFGTKQTINKITLKNIEESAIFFAQDVFICSSSDIVNILKNDLKYTAVTNCKKAKERLESGINVTIEVLIKHNYIDKGLNCSGIVLVRTSNNKMANIEADASSVICTD